MVIISLTFLNHDLRFFLKRCDLIELQKAVVSWTYDPAERDPRLVNKILNKEKKKKSLENLKVIVEISCTTSPNHLIAVRKAYCSLFDSSLEEHIASSLPFPLAKVSPFFKIR